MNPILGVSLVFSFSVFYSFSSKSTSSFSAFVKIPFTVLFFNPSSYGTAPLTYWPGVSHHVFGSVDLDGFFEKDLFFSSKKAPAVF